MGLGRTARGRSFVYHAGTAVDSVGGTCGSRGGMVSWPRSWHTPCRAWYWCQGTRSLRSTRSARRMWSHRDCGIRRQETWCRSGVDAMFHHSVTVSCHGPQVLSHMLRNATFQRMRGAFGGGMVPRRARPIPSYLAPEPFNPEHASVPAHRQPRYPVRTVESDNTPPLEDPFPHRSGGGPAAYCNIFGAPGIVILHG